MRTVSHQTFVINSCVISTLSPSRDIDSMMTAFLFSKSKKIRSILINLRSSISRVVYGSGFELTSLQISPPTQLFLNESGHILESLTNSYQGVWFTSQIKILFGQNPIFIFFLSFYHFLVCALSVFV